MGNSTLVKHKPTNTNIIGTDISKSTDSADLLIAYALLAQMDFN
jgi:hypothetical protein